MTSNRLKDFITCRLYAVTGGSSVERATRRQFIGTLTAGAGALLAAQMPSAQAPFDKAQGGQPAAARRIDIHQHFVSPSFLAFLGAKNAVSPVAGFAAWKD